MREVSECQGMRITLKETPAMKRQLKVGSQFTGRIVLSSFLLALQKVLTLLPF